MNDIIYFPPKNKVVKQLYYTIHIKFFIEVFAFASFNVDTKENLNVIGNSFEVEYNGNIILMDFGDSSSLPDTEKYSTVFKSHCLVDSPTIKSWSPISFYDWKQYEELSLQIKYNSTHNTVLNNQRAYANALTRREYVKKLLIEQSSSMVDFTITDEVTWWKKFSNCLCYVHVPGFCNNMIDRGQMQAFFFGVPVITTYLPELLPNDVRFEAGEHYIIVKDDYSDLIEKIEWCKTNRDKIIKIGENAKILCRKHLMPKELTEWFRRNV